MNQTSAESSSLTTRDRVAVLAAMIFPSIAVWFYFVGAAGAQQIQLFYGISKVIQFGFPVFWVLAIQRARPGLQRPSVRGLGISFGFGLLASAVALAFYFGYLRDSAAYASVPQRIAEKTRSMGAGEPIRFLALAAFISVVHSLLEEYYYRWFIYGQLRRWTGSRSAIWLSSLAFMAHHVILLGVFFGTAQVGLIAFLSLGVALGGAAWAWIYERCGALYGPWLSHLLVDVALMLIGYDAIWGLWR
jgi:membrane protease YdiL (CAAX protease family)